MIIIEYVSGFCTFMQSMLATMNAMRDDFDTSRKCNLIFANKGLFSLFAGWAFPKNASLYRENFAKS